MCVLGMAEEFREQGVAVNALWPGKIVHTSAVDMLVPTGFEYSRKTSVMSDAAYAILIRDPRHCTGNFFIDEKILTDSGVKDLSQYAHLPQNADKLIISLPHRSASKM